MHALMAIDGSLKSSRKVGGLQKSMRSYKLTKNMMILDGLQIECLLNWIR